MEDNRYLVDYSNVNRFAILQLSEADIIERGKRYSSFSSNGKYTANDYEISYFEIEEPNKKIDLEDIYSRFNGIQPDNYYGHNLSVSDVILESHNGEINAYYVDKVGFEKLDTEFMTEKIEKRFKYGLDVSKELEEIKNNAGILQAVLGEEFNAEEREDYLLANYSDIFALAKKRSIYNVMIRNQDKLKAIYEDRIENPLPFPDVKEENGLYLLDEWATEKTAEETEEEINRMYEDIFYEPIKNNEVTVYLRYDEEKNINGWKKDTDSITFNDLKTAMKYVNKEEAVYDYIDDYYEIKEDETPLYIKDSNGQVIWENTEYVEKFINDVETDKLTILNNGKQILNTLCSMQGMSCIDDFKISVYGEKIPVNGLTLSFEDLTSKKSSYYMHINNNYIDFKDDMIEELDYKDIKIGKNREEIEHELKKNREQLLDKYEAKGFEFPLREEYSDKYIINLCNAIEQAEKQGYSDNTVIRIAKAKARYIDVDKAIRSIPLVKNADLVANVGGIEFYARKDDPTLIITYDENYRIEGDEDVLKACRRIYDNYYAHTPDLPETAQEMAYRQRVYTDDEIIGAINKEAGIIEFDRLAEEDYVILDTETTGLGIDDEVIELGIIDKNNDVLYESMFKPYKEISSEAKKINGIDENDLLHSPDFSYELEKIVGAIGNKKVVIFNKSFDTKMILQTAEIEKRNAPDIHRYEELLKKLRDIFDNRTYCAMQSYAEMVNSYKVINLNKALKDNGIDTIQSHRAVGDCSDTLKLINACIQKKNLEREITYAAEENSMNNEKENVTLGEEPKQEDKSAKAELVERLKQGVKDTLDSENFANWCRQQGKLYYNKYSLNNAFLTLMQNPEASYVCGYEQWKDFGRQVQKGAKGIKIFSPMFVNEKYGKGSLYAFIKKNCSEQIKNGSEYGTFSFKGSDLVINMQKNYLFDVKIGDKACLSHATTEEFKKFLDRSVIGKVPVGYNVVTVFDIKDTTKESEFLWVKRDTCKKEELVLDKNGEPIRNNKGQYKIYNSDERRNSFEIPLDISIKENDIEKLEILYAALRELSEKKGIPVTESEPARDSVLSNGARGYFRNSTEKFPKGNIVISSELPMANKVSTLFHEIAHSDLHADISKLKSDIKLGENENVSRQMKEIQAEGVAYMTASNFGIETDHKSFNYIASWSDGRELKTLEESMNVIYKESKKLMEDIEKVLDEKGLKLNLEAKDITPLSEDERKLIAAPFSDYSLNGLRKIEAIQKQAFTELKQTDNEQVQTIIKEQIYLTRQAELKLNEIYEKTEKLIASDDKKSQINLEMQLKSLKTQVDNINVSFDKLSKERVDLVIENYKTSEKKDLRSLYAVDSKQAFKELSKIHSELKDLSDNDLKFLATNDFIKREYSKLLDTDTKKFVELSLKHLEDMKSVMSKHNTAVEITSCEQWTDKPIFNKAEGYLMHPALANKVIGNAEKQIELLKKEAEKKGEYFPYSKCKLSVHSITEVAGKNKLSSLVTVIDIGDGEQKDLQDHVEKILSSTRSKEKKQILANLSKSVKERSNINSVEAVYYNELKEVSYVDEQSVSEKSSTLGMSMSDWKNKVISNPVQQNNETKEKNVSMVKE